jgi:hypothetical protein
MKWLDAYKNHIVQIDIIRRTEADFVNQTDLSWSEKFREILPALNVLHQVEDIGMSNDYVDWRALPLARVVRLSIDICDSIPVVFGNIAQEDGFPCLRVLHIGRGRMKTAYVSLLSDTRLIPTLACLHTKYGGETFEQQCKTVTMQRQRLHKQLTLLSARVIPRIGKDSPLAMLPSDLLRYMFLLM